MGISRPAVLVIAVLGVLTLAAVLGSAWTTPDCRGLLASGRSFDTAVVLGGGGVTEGALAIDSRDRAEAAVALYRAGQVRHLHFTGYASEPSELSGAEGMRELALAAGVPPEAMSIEPRSRSTLENALFSRPMLEDAGRLLLVSEGFHLWRGAASMAWAGRPVAGVCKSSAFAPGRTAPDLAWVILREGAAWWLNILRGGVWRLAAATGLQHRLPDSFLH